jgi:hypothetical protein
MRKKRRSFLFLARVCRVGRKAGGSAIVGGKLYLISYAAPALHYFDAHLAKAQAIMDSAKVQ